MLPIPISSPIQPLRDSRLALIVLVFPNSRSPNRQAAVNLAEQAERYTALDIDGACWHLAQFARTPAQVDLALALINMVKGWKGTQAFVSGRACHDIWRLEQVLGCLQQATRCHNPSAHCQTVITDYNVPPPRFSGFFGGQSVQPVRWLHPCRLIAQYGANRVDPAIQASATDQLQAQAVRYECEWCPNFKPADYRRL